MFYVNWEWWTNNTGSTVRCQICDELVGSGELVKGVKGARWYYVHPECLEKYIKYDEMRTKALSRFFSGKNDEGEEIFKSITKIGIEINQTIVEIDDITKFLETLKDKKEIIEAAKKSKQSFMRKVKPYLVPLDNKFSRLFEEYEKEIRQNKARLNRLEDLTDEDVKERDEVNDLIKNMEMKYDNFKKRYNMTRKTILEITYEDLRPVGLHFRPDNPIESRTDYKKIINEAEENSEKDKAKREGIEARNLGESTVYAAEKLLKEQGDKVSEESKTEIESGVTELKEILAEEELDVTKLTEATNNLQTSMQKLGESVYSQTENDDSGQDSGDDGPKDETVEGEYKEV